MSYPEKTKLSAVCSSCSGALYRKTIDPAKPLGQVACEGCTYSETIQEYVDKAQAAAKAKAQARLAQEN